MALWGSEACRRDSSWGMQLCIALELGPAPPSYMALCKWFCLVCGVGKSAGNSPKTPAGVCYVRHPAEAVFALTLSPLSSS